jgi:hypothetical protein
MARYRRGTLSDGDRWAASAVSILVGSGAALATYYLTRLFLSREELPGRRIDAADLGALEEPSRPALGDGRSSGSGGAS